MGAKIDTVYLKESEYDQWNEFVANSSYGSIYNTPEYLDVLCGVTDGTFKILAAKQGDKIVGGIALYQRTSNAGQYVSPRLLLYYNGLVLLDFDSIYHSKNVSHQIAALTALEEALSKENYKTLHFRNRSSFYDARIFQMKHWLTRLNYTYTVYIEDIEQLWSKVDPNLRRLINRCKKQNYYIVKDDDFDSFYNLHLDTHERKGSPLYLPYDKYKVYYDRLRSLDLCSLYNAHEENGKVVSSQLVLKGVHPVTHTVCAATDEAFLNSGVSAFIRWKVFEDLSEQGYKANDLTDAALNAVTRFKSQLGGELQMCIDLVKQTPVNLRIDQLMIKKLKKGIKKIIYRSS